MQKEDEKVGFCFVCTSLLLDEKTFLRNLQKTFRGPYWPKLYISPGSSCKGEYKGKNVGRLLTENNVSQKTDFKASL